MIEELLITGLFLLTFLAMIAIIELMTK